MTKNKYYKEKFHTKIIVEFEIDNYENQNYKDT